MLVYATPEELAAWTGTDAPTNAVQLLRSASLLVRRETKTAVYWTDTTGLPTDTALVTALRDATTAQAAAWAAAGIDPTGGAATVTGLPKSSSIGSGSIDFGTREGSDTDRAALADQLAPDAAQILADAGLLSPYVAGW